MVLYRLDEAINKHYQAYDIIFIDTHADFGLRSQSALAASNAFAAPVELSDYSALNIGALLNDYNAIKRRINKYLKFHGFIVNRVDQFNSSLGRKEPKKLSQRQMYQDIQKFCENYEKTSGASLKIIGMLGNRNPVGAFSSGINLPRLEKDENAYLEALEVVEGILTLMVHGE
jgi:cellulose biosynthesis protein BcsQ